jgi:large subunit ribosomal protein L4
VHQVVVAFQANARQGAGAKNEKAVKHSTKKPWRQKGTGRALATSSPLWRGGGRTPNSPDENFSHKLNKKMYRAGMASILSQLARDGRRLAVVDTLKVDSPKTKLLAQKLKAMGLDSVLVIADTVDENLALASRNLANVLVVEPRYRPVVAGVLQEGAGHQGAIEQLNVRMAPQLQYQSRASTTRVAWRRSCRPDRVREGHARW